MVNETPLEFARRLGLPFTNQHLLTRALTHSSYLNEHPETLEDNERLEFLGDAVLDFLTSAWLYNHFPEMAEGRLTSLRAALVRNEQLAEFSRQINLGEAILLGRGGEESGGRERPSLLGSTFEALVGALYLDVDLEAVQNFLETLLQPAIEKILLDNRDQDSKNLLQEHSQAEGIGTPHYRTISSSGPVHQPTYQVEVLIGDQVYGVGTGPSKQAATKSAAQDALLRITRKETSTTDLRRFTQIRADEICEIP